MVINEDGLTPVVIRGKRHYGNGPKPRSRSSRPVLLQVRQLPDVKQKHDVHRMPKRRKVRVELSLLEQLPVELIQTIFRYSTNPDLPLTSRHLAATLDRTQHLQMHFATSLLGPVFHCRNGSVDKSALKPARRLLECRFVTLSFFKRWLTIGPQQLSLGTFLGDARTKWALLEPATNLFPPVKLMTGPFTDEKVEFLRIFTGHARNMHDADPVVADIAIEGVKQAIRENAVGAIRGFATMGTRLDTEMLRIAVIDSGCDRTIVSTIIFHGMANSDCHELIDYLDPQLWAWAERARGQNDHNGEWLMQRLRAAINNKSNRLESHDEEADA